MILRFLFSLPLADRPRLVTTDAEFHTLRRQLARLAEEGLDVVRVPGRPVATVAERIAAAVDEQTSAVLMSSVYYETAEIVPNLSDVARSCAIHGAELLVDAYHHLNVVPFDLRAMGLSDAFVTGGGYKYCQLGEGNAFLRIPWGRVHMRPVLTGWFSEFGELEEPPGEGRVAYGMGVARWAGATYDPSSHYRASAVFEFFDAHGLTAQRLRDISQHQLELMLARCGEAPLAGRVRAIGVEGAGGLSGVGGFLALEVNDARDVQRRLRDAGVLSDHRGNILRLGPAPYLTDAQIEDAMDRLGNVIA
jgi:selenocysteine lyase/cysteine desulfurase